MERRRSTTRGAPEVTWKSRTSLSTRSMDCSPRLTRPKSTSLGRTACATRRIEQVRLRSTISQSLSCAGREMRASTWTGAKAFFGLTTATTFMDYFDNPEHSYLGPDIHGVGITHAGVRLVTGRRYNVVQPVETEDAEQQSSYDDQGFLRMNDNDRYEAAFADAHESPKMEQESGCAHAHERVADAVSCYSSQNEALAGSEGWWVEGYGVARLSDGLMLSKNDIEFIAMTQETGG